MPGKAEEIEKSIAGLLKSLNQTRTNTDKLLGSANKLIEPNSVLDTELNNMLQEGGGPARSLVCICLLLPDRRRRIIASTTCPGSANASPAFSLSMRWDSLVTRFCPPADRIATLNLRIRWRGLCVCGGSL